MPSAHPLLRLLRSSLILAFLLLPGSALSQLSAPTFGARGGVPTPIIEAFMSSFRSELGRATGLEVRNGELITPGIAGSLEPEFALLIADLDGARYALSGEIAAPSMEGEPFGVNLIVVDAELNRSSDLMTWPLDQEAPKLTARALAELVAEFTQAAHELPPGNAGVFVSSEPGEAQVFIDGVSIGRTSLLDVAMLAPGRYRLELRKDGFLPDSRTVDLRGGDTTFVHVAMTAIAGGSIQVNSQPPARVFLGDTPSGVTPVTLPARPGTHRVTLSRAGFVDETFELLVRNYRVTRLQATLTPSVEPLVFWKEEREHHVLIDGRLQLGDYAEGLEPGLREFELMRLGRSRTFLRAVPERGVFELDLETGELLPFGDN